MKIFESFREINERKTSTVERILASGIFEYKLPGGNIITKKNPTIDTINKFIEGLCEEYFFDRDFFHNISNRRDYYKAFEREILQPFLKNPDSFFDEYIVILPMQRLPQRTIYGIREINSREFINNFFRTSKSLTPELKDQYNFHRWSYANEKVDPANYEYLSKNGNKIKRK